MSRAYRIELKTKEITEEQIKKVMIEELGWEEIDLSSFKGITYFEGEGRLYGGCSEEEAHQEISQRFKKLNPKAKIRTTWTYLEDLPYEEYGDDIEEQ